jgi:hypothetical protein
MHSLIEMAKALNRLPGQITALQTRFELPVCAGPTYPDSYLQFLRTILALRTFDISVDSLVDLWQFEKKLLQLLHVDTTGSPTWFLDACGATTHPERRLLLTNYDLGVPLTATEVQTGLNFGDSLAELFAGQEMGEDALRVLRQCLKRRDRIRSEVGAELAQVRAAVKWATHLK